jgi:NAD+ kinase
MSERKLKFAIFGNEYKKSEVEPYIERVLRYLEAHDAEAMVEPVDFNNADYVISMGGDGTFLRAASKVGNREIPIVGVNMGRLGFLADILPSEIEETLDNIFNGNYSIEQHTVIEVEADGAKIEGSPYALNDVAILKRDSASMISVRTYINDEFLVNYQADGLVISTPTGSTAYNLSNGGPIIVPRSSSLCLTPVAPHSLNIRPIVINDTSVITMDVESRSHSFLVAIDGRSEKMVEGTKITIRKAPFVIKIVKQNNRRYFSSLREKLMWGADNRK